MSDSTPIRFIHSSDWQIGMTRAFLSAEAGARFTQARIDAISALGELALNHGAQFMVVAGDVFESNQLARTTLLRALDVLRTVPVPVFLLPGNHDPLDTSSLFNTSEILALEPQITVLRNLEPHPVPGVPGVEVVGAPWLSKQPTSDLCEPLTALPASGDSLRVAVAHGQVNTLAPDPSRPEIINLARIETAMAEQRLHYLALGDRHSTTALGQTGRIWYSGTPLVTAFDETEPNQALLVELAPDSCAVTPLPVGDWSFVAAERELNGPADLTALADWLDSFSNKPRTALKVGLRGSLNIAAAAELDTLLEARETLFASLKQRARTSELAVLPDALDESTLNLQGYAQASWNELLETARQAQAAVGGSDQAPEDTAAADALRLFYRLAGRVSR